MEELAAIVTLAEAKDIVKAGALLTAQLALGFDR
jgi:hypothetical protein